MAAASFMQTSFLSGIWSKRRQGRIDEKDYRQALNICINNIPVEQGALTRRPGTKLIGPTFAGKQAELLSFEFKQASPYTLEATSTPGEARFIVGDTRFAITNDAQVVVSITTVIPPKVKTTTAHGWTTGDQAQFINLGNNATILQGQQFFITVTSATEFTLTDAFGGPVNGALLNGSAAGSTVQRLLRVALPYTLATDLPNLRPVQTEQSMVILHGNYNPQLVKAVTFPTTTLDATFTSTTPLLLDGPYLDEVTTGETISSSAFTGSVTLTASGTAFGGFAATDVGRIIRLYSEPALWSAATNYAAGDLVQYNGVNYISLTAGNLGHPPDAFIANWAIQVNIAGWAWFVITAFTNSTTITALLSGNQALLYAIPIRRWRLGAYGGLTGFPTCGTYHEGRLWLGGAIPNRFDASQPNDIFNFAPTLPNGQVTPANAISYTLNGPGTNQMYWMQPDLQGIIIGTQAGEWLVQATSQNLPLTPTSIQAHRVTKIRCANVEPRRTEHTTVFVQAYGRKIMEYFADVYSGKFSAPHLTDKAKHLTNASILGLAYQQEMVPIIWARRGDGILIGATYKRDTLATSQGPTFYAWHEHRLGHSRFVESMCFGGSADGSRDTLVMSTRDTIGVRWIEILTEITEEGSPLSEYWLLDGAVQPTSSIQQIVGGFASQIFYGLTNLNGHTVSMTVGGLDCGDFLVSGGSITVPFGDGISAGTGNGQFTAALLASGAPVIIGYSYTSQAQIVRPATPAESGARTGPALAKKRRAHQYGLEVESTAGISIGTDFTKLYPVPFVNEVGTSLPVLATFTGIYWDNLNDDYSFDSMLCWQSTRPLPATIAAIGSMLHTQDT